MVKPATLDSLQYLFTYPFQDKAWPRKFLFGFLFFFASLFVPIIPWIFLYGYYARIIENTIEEPTNPTLPEWDDWNDLFVKGLRLLGVFLVVFLPFLLLFLLGYAAMFFPLFLADQPPSGDSSVSPFLFFFPFFGMFAWLAVMGIGFLLLLLAGVVLPPAIGHVVAKEQFSAAFRVREWWPIFRANLGGFLLSYVLLFGTIYLFSFALQILYLTIILCLLLPFVMAFFGNYFGFVSNALIGQAYGVGVKKLGAGK